ncbi:MAG: hypothetical protein BGO67_05695 [Alphaproteobacteria bacterium 41-28]|nr:MAG: hypothetical protein BGO67_05695 [Alphaproteobacteria bacterium 41-28]
MQLFLKTPPIQEPLTLEEVKTYLRVSSDQEEEYLSSLITSARAYVENVTGRALLKQQWLMQIKPPYPRASPLIKCERENLEIDLPYPPLLEVESVKTGMQEIPFMIEENKALLPSSFWNKEITMTYWAGYGQTPDSLPPDLKLAVLMATRFFYDHQKVDLPLLRPFKVFRIS